MSMELWQRLKALEAEVKSLKEKPAPGGPFPFERLEKLEEAIRKLENQYRMLNARISRKSE